MSMQSLGSAEESRLAVEESFPLVKMKSTSRTKHHKVTIKQRPKGSRSSRMPLGDSDEMVEEIKPKKAKKKSDSEKETGSEDESKEKKKKKVTPLLPYYFNASKIVLNRKRAKRTPKLPKLPRKPTTSCCRSRR